LSKRVIKAHTTRLLPAEKRHHKEPPETDETFEYEEADEFDFEPVQTETEQRPSYQEAYDEVIEAAQQEVALLLKDARAEARAIVGKAEANVEKAQEQGYNDGAASGHEDGYAAALDHAGRAFAELFEEGQRTVDDYMEQAVAERDRMLDEMEPKILRLALDIAGKIIGMEIDRDDGVFPSIVRTALDLMKQEGRVTIRINPEQYNTAFRSKAEARIKTARGSVEAELIADHAVEPGGCLIETDNGTVDASVGAQLEQMARNMGME
jgi:flagellar assembly protein FliH